MDETNMIERMLMKGDRMKPRYKSFDYSSIDDSQKFWLGKLAVFSKYRERIINRYNGSGISSDIKIMFLDQHSMRIGHAIFYNLEGSRQEYLQALENYSLIATILGFGFFCVFAVRTPIYSKLYRELGYSAVLGATFGYSYAYKYKLKYLDVVDESYDVVKQKFTNEPHLIEGVDNEDNSPIHIKNFGLSQWNDGDTEDDWDMTINSQSVMEGTAQQEKDERRKEMFNRYYGE